MKTYAITGNDAKRLATRDCLTLRENDDGEPLVIVRANGWVLNTGTKRQRSVSIVEGYNVSDYFTSSDIYLGPDDDGTEPRWDDAPEGCVAK